MEVKISGLISKMDFQKSVCNMFLIKPHFEVKNDLISKESLDLISDFPASYFGVFSFVNFAYKQC